MFPLTQTHFCESRESYKEVVITPEYSFSIPQILIFKQKLEYLATLFALLQGLSYLVEFIKSNSASHSKLKGNNTKPYPAFLHC